MKLAFIDNLPVGGGLSRFSLLLCKSLVEHCPLLEIDYYVHNDNLKHIPEIMQIGERVRVKVLKSSKPASLRVRIAQKLRSKAGLMPDDDKVMKEIQSKVDKTYNLAYFPSAHMMKRPKLNIPIVGTIHDFNWKYFFGREIFPRAFVEMMDVEILNWLNEGHTICSSQDVVDEGRKLYPQVKQLPTVVNIGPLVVHKEIDEQRATEILKNLNINYPYIIFPGNFYPHKNHLNLFTAFSLLRQRKGFEHYKLILTGMNSDQVQKGIAEKRGLRLLTKNSTSDSYDVIGLGYQPNEVIDVLIARARLLVSPSVYEAICTPGMDAWTSGTPTAISDIPPFREHESVWGIRSAFFDPMDPAAMADVIEAYLNNYENALADGLISKKNINNYTWKQVAEGYMNIFIKATKTV